MFQYFINHIVACCTTVLRLCNFFFQHIHVRLEHSNRLFEFFDFAASAQQITWILKCTTCHGSARIDQVTFQCDQTQRLAVFSRNCDSVINMVYYNRASKQLICQSVKSWFHMDQCIRKSDHARLFECFRIPDSSAAMHTCQRKKCCPSEFITLKEINHTLGCIFIICNNILNTSSKRCLNSDLIFLIDLNDIRYNTDQTFLTFFIRHYLSYTVTISVIALCNIL